MEEGKGIPKEREDDRTREDRSLFIIRFEAGAKENTYRGDLNGCRVIVWSGRVSPKICVFFSFFSTVVIVGPPGILGAE